MNLDDNARRSASAVRQELADLEVPDAKDVVRRHRNRRLTRVAAVATVIMVAAAIPFTIDRSSTDTVTVTAPEVATPPENPVGLPDGSVTESGWTSIPKSSAGFGVRTSFSSLASTDTAIIAAGAELSGDDWTAALWRSTDGLNWNRTKGPDVLGEISAIGAADDALLAIGSDASLTYVWQSTDDGRSWQALAEDSDLFGSPAPEMGRPFVDGLRWSNEGFWIASGGASSGYAGVWTSLDGIGWVPVLPQNNVGSVDVVESATGDLLAYSSNQAWTSTSGATWTGSDISIQDPYVITDIASGTSRAIGEEPVSGEPTPLLRSEDSGSTWTVDSSLLDDHPEAVAVGIDQFGDTTIVFGHSGQPNRPDAWVRNSDAAWIAMPDTLNGTPGGILHMIGKIGDRIVMASTAAELERYYTLELSELDASPVEAPENLWTDIGADWTPLPDGPADGRTFPVSLWTGTELIIWGGETQSETEWSNDGAAFDPASGTWRTLARSPLSPRSEHVAVWTGDEMIVCCGRAPGGDGATAAAYDPVVDRWRELAEPPFEADFVVAVWTGDEMIVTGGADFDRTYAYRPEGDQWRRLADAPHEIGPGPDVAWTGEKVVLWPSINGTGPGITYEPATDEWTELPTVPTDLDVWGGSMVWTGTDVIVWGNSSQTETDAVGARLRPGESHWRPIADDPLAPFDWWEGTPGSDSAIWTGREMLVWTGAMGDPEPIGAPTSTRTLAYNPSKDTWRELDRAPGSSFGPEMIWTGDVAIVIGDPSLAIAPNMVPDAPAGETAEEAEATDIPFPECGLLAEPGPPEGARAKQLKQLRSDLEADGLMAQPTVVGVGGPQSLSGVISVGLSHRNQSTIDWLADRASPEDLCLDLPPAGYYQQPPTLADWELGSTGTDDATLTLLVTIGRCGLLDDSRILEPQVDYTDTEVIIGMPLRVETYGPTSLPCRAPTELTVELDEPLSGRTVVPATELATN